LGIDLAKCLTRIALGLGELFGWLNRARRLCHFFTFIPSSTSRRIASNRRPQRLEPRRRKPDCFALLFTPALDPTIIKYADEHQFTYRNGQVRDDLPIVQA
jgi:hypothetical protein